MAAEVGRKGGFAGRRIEEGKKGKTCILMLVPKTHSNLRTKNLRRKPRESRGGNPETIMEKKGKEKEKRRRKGKEINVEQKKKKEVKHFTGFQFVRELESW